MWSVLYKTVVFSPTCVCVVYQLSQQKTCEREHQIVRLVGVHYSKALYQIVMSTDGV